MARRNYKNPWADWKWITPVMEKKRSMGKGDKHKAETIELLRKLALEQHAKKRKAQSDRWEAERRKSRRAVERGSVQRAMRAATEGKRWWAYSEINQCWPSKGSLKRRLHNLRLAGVVVRMANPEWEGPLRSTCGLHVEPIEQCQWLYRWVKPERQKRPAGERGA